MNVNDEQNPKMKTKKNSSRSNSNSSNKEQRREEEPSLTLAFDPIVRGIVLDLDDLQDLVRTFTQRYRECMLSLSKIINDVRRIDDRYQFHLLGIIIHAVIVSETLLYP